MKYRQTYFSLILGRGARAVVLAPGGCGDASRAALLALAARNIFNGDAVGLAPLHRWLAKKKHPIIMDKDVFYQIVRFCFCFLYNLHRIGHRRGQIDFPKPRKAPMCIIFETSKS